MPLSATAAFTAATLPYVIALRRRRPDGVYEQIPGLAAGVSVRGERVLLESLMPVS